MPKSTYRLGRRGRKHNSQPDLSVLCIGLTLCLLSCGPSGSRSAVLEMSMTDKNAPERLLNILAGKADAQLEIEAGLNSKARRNLAYLALGELVLHPLTTAQLESTLAAIDQLRVYDVSWPMPLRPRKLRDNWPDPRLQEMVADLSSDLPSARLKAILELRICDHVMPLSAAIRTKSWEPTSALVTDEDPRIQLHAWAFVFRHHAYRRKLRDAYLEHLTDSTGELRSLLLQNWTQFTSPNIRKMARRIVFTDLRGGDPVRQRAAFVAVAQARRSNLMIYQRDEVLDCALGMLGEEDPALLLAALKVLHEAPTSSFSGKKQALASSSAPLTSHPNIHLRTQLTAILALHLSKHPAGKKLLRTLSSDPDPAVRAAAAAALD
jgi:hypothetical protein